MCRAVGGSAAASAAASGAGGRRVLASITALKKLCNHPRLIFDAIRANAASAQAGGGGAADAAGLEDCALHFDPTVSVDSFIYLHCLHEKVLGRVIPIGCIVIADIE